MNWAADDAVREPQTMGSRLEAGTFKRELCLLPICFQNSFAEGLVLS